MWENYIARHTIAVVKDNDKYYLVDNELQIYDNLESILNRFIKQFPSMYKIKDFDKSKIEIYEYEKPEAGLNYYEFSDYVRKGVRIWIS